MKVIGVIPARMDSTRLPGKPLLELCGKPMVWWVYQTAKQVKRFRNVIVATDHEDIKKVCEKYHMEVIMTKNGHPTAIHRLHEVADKIPADFYVQINGDEPLLKAEVIDEVIPNQLYKEKEYGINLITNIKSPVELADLANIKMVFDENCDCMYMSRNPIPAPFGTLKYTYYKHVGIIGYNRGMLDFYVNSVPRYYEQIEGIDLMRFVEYRKRLHLVKVNDIQTLSVDTEKDLLFVRQVLETRLP